MCVHGIPPFHLYYTIHHISCKDVYAKTYDKVYALATACNADKHSRAENFELVKAEYKANYGDEELAEKGALIDRYYHDVEKDAMRRSILDEGKRLDGRKTTEIRLIWSEVVA